MDQLQPWEKEYLRFFDEIVSISGDDSPRIVVNNLLVSELINACISREYSQYKNFIGKEISKKEFRSLEEYEDLLADIVDEIESYSEFIDILYDTQLNPIDDILTKLPTQLDYCDYYYYELALEHNLVIVTNDGDFLVPGVDILTTHRGLLYRNGD